MKPCKDCRHYVAPALDVLPSAFSKCLRFQTSMSVIDGSLRPSFCDLTRADASKCGPDGNGWEAK